MRSFANLVHPQILGVWWSCDWPMPGPFPVPPPGKSALGTRLEINDAEHNPNRRTISTKYFPRHCIPSKGRSSGWIAQSQMQWRGKYFVDLVLPFKLRSAPFIFTCIADLVEWILVHNYGVDFLRHYLDDFFTLGPPSSPL